MKILRFQKLVMFVCYALGSSSVWAQAKAVTGSFETRYIHSRFSEITLPDSCTSPYREAPNFIEFFTTTLYVMAAQKGAQSPGVTDLFAVKGLRDKMREIFPNLGEESAMDRLIVAQVCLFQKIQQEKYAQPGQAPLVIAPTDPELQKHLISIAPRLYQDSRKLMIEALAIRAKERKQNLNLERQWGEILRATERGDEKNRDLLRDIDLTSF